MKALKYLNKYFFKYKYYFLIGIFITVFSKILALAWPGIVGDSLDVVDDYRLHHSITLEELKHELLINFLKIVGYAILSGFFTFLMRQTIIVSSRNIEFDLKNEIYDQYQRLSSRFYKQNRTGDLMNRISEDVSKVRMYFGPAIMYSINLVLLFVIAFTKMININVKLTLWTIAPMPILSISIFILSKVINERSQIVQKYLSKLTTLTQEVMSGINVIKSYNLENHKESDFDLLADETKNKNINLYKAQALFFPLMVLLIGISNLMVIYIGGMEYIKGVIGIGVIAEFIIYVNMLTWPVAALGWVTSIIQQAEASQQRINEFLEEVPEIVNENQQKSSIKGSIKFENVSLVYPDTNIKALDGINLNIPSGKSIAILGKTGSGKSSILQLIARLYDASSGTVFIDDIPIKEINLYDLRNHIGTVPQEPFLFSESIADNIRFGKEDATINEIEEASKMAAIHDNIISFNHGYDTILGERGVTLSGGQKQRVSIARAFIKKPEILLLDDSLSAVDTETEAQILDGIKQISKGRTSVIVSHRVSSAKNADYIYVLDQGKIVQEGNHDLLIKMQGYYKSLYEQQLLEKEI
ncbi:ABC transporter ATP-binding protein/permease [Flavobacteriaceae bacterium]|nr:ABC transporter ATP-binding protein/permease [Flavobacteriaceae bacterium]